MRKPDKNKKKKLEKLLRIVHRLFVSVGRLDQHCIGFELRGRMLRPVSTFPSSHL